MGEFGMGEGPGTAGRAGLRGTRPGEAPQPGGSATPPLPRPLTGCIWASVGPWICRKWGGGKVVSRGADAPTWAGRKSREPGSVWVVGLPRALASGGSLEKQMGPWARGSLL